MSAPLRLADVLAITASWLLLFWVFSPVGNLLQRLLSPVPHHDVMMLWCFIVVLLLFLKAITMGQLLLLKYILFRCCWHCLLSWHGLHCFCCLCCHGLLVVFSFPQVDCCLLISMASLLAPTNDSASTAACLSPSPPVAVTVSCTALFQMSLLFLLAVSLHRQSIVASQKDF